MQLLGAMHLEMNESGAIFDGSAYKRAGLRTRLIHGAGQLISEVRARYARTPGVISDDVVVCVGSRDTASLPDNVATGNKSDSIVRPGLSGLWLTDEQAQEYFRQLRQDAHQNDGAYLPIAANAEE